VCVNFTCLHEILYTFVVLYNFGNSAIMHIYWFCGTQMLVICELSYMKNKCDCLLLSGKCFPFEQKSVISSFFRVVDGGNFIVNGQDGLSHYLAYSSLCQKECKLMNFKKNSDVCLL
jgi:hypothetical protein